VSQAGRSLRAVKLTSQFSCSEKSEPALKHGPEGDAKELRKCFDMSLMKKHWNEVLLFLNISLHNSWRA
jgi:hypothetical protein